MMFIGKFDLDLFSDDISQTKNKALVRIEIILFMIVYKYYYFQTDEEINKMQTNESFTPL